MSVALVTGASRGIGRAIALRLARDGFVVAVNYCDRHDAAEEVVPAIEEAGGHALAFPADAGDPSAVRELVHAVVDKLSGLDVLVNNAGAGEMRPLAEVTVDELRANLRVNLLGPFVAMQEAAKLMPSTGRIVNVSTSLTSMLLPGTVLGAPAKCALEALTTIAAKELGALGITVNAVGPGTTDTDAFNVNPAHVREAMAASSPFGRLGQPDETAGVVSFLVSSDCGWVSGPTLRVNGALV
ncbi:SDR family oxidoreductase [Streptomyces sp. NPDC055105]|uniref:SDR family oxidoreductase n=1 Tax=Streptomyces sp. NPDC055105 TaxID=3365719 RepID=UPI0037CCE290